MILPVGRLVMEYRLALLALFVSPEANLISTADSTGALPLHIACQNRDTPIDVLQFLVEQDPTTVRRRDNQGNLPIHTLCASNPMLASVMYLLPQSGDEAFHTTNRQGRTPLMVALLTARHDVLFYLVLHAHPDVLVAESPPLFVK